MVAASILVRVFFALAAVHIGLVLETRHHGFVPRLSSSPTHDLVLTIGSWIFLINLATAQNILPITTTTHASQI